METESGHGEKIGIMGGSFNPIHYGHTVIAETVRDELGLDKVYFIPAGYPPHKDNEGLASPEDRFKMVELAVAANPYFEPSRIEIDRGKTTYTIDTIKEFRSKYPENTRIYFIIGADTVSQLQTWKDFFELFSICRFAVVSRQGYDDERLRKDMKRLTKEYGAKFKYVKVPYIDISSTEIRNRLISDKTIKYSKRFT